MIVDHALAACPVERRPTVHEQVDLADAAAFFRAVLLVAGA